MENVVDESQKVVDNAAENSAGQAGGEEANPTSTPKRRGRPKGSTTASTGTRRRGRPPKTGAGKRSGRVPKTAVGLAEQFEAQIEARFQAKLDAAHAQIATLKAEAKAAQKREKAALKLFERQEKSLSAFVTKWNTRELAKVHKEVSKIKPSKGTGKRRGRPPKAKATAK